MNTLTYTSFAISPLLIILVYLIMKYSFSIKKGKNIGNAVLLGFLCASLIYITSYAANIYFKGDVHTIKRMGFYVFVVIAFSAELAKFLAVRFTFFRRSNFIGPIEGIVYSIFIGLGYATVAVVLFGFNLIGTRNNADMLLFLYTYPFANIIFAIAMGFFVGLSKTRKIPIIDDGTGLFLATFLHGLFYFSFQTSDFRLLLMTSLGLLVIGVTLFMRAASIRNSRDD